MVYYRNLPGSVSAGGGVRRVVAAFAGRWKIEDRRWHARHHGEPSAPLKTPPLAGRFIF